MRARSGRPVILAVSGSMETVPASALFVLVGAEPRTDWLPAEIERGEKGFVTTGGDLVRGKGYYPGGYPGGWPLGRPPLLLETSIPGAFAAGDVRHASVKRVAYVVGEGSIAIQPVHE